MASPLHRAIYHDDNYAKANSIVGDRIAAARGVWADRDLTYCLYGRVILNHWAEPEHEDWTLNGKRVTRPFRKIPLYRVLRMVAPGGYKIRTLAQGMKDAEEIGVPGMELDLKFVPSLYRFIRMAGVARKVWGPGWQQHVEVKIWSHLDWKTALRRAKRVGFKTTVIRFEGDPDRLPSYVDHYRR